MISKDIWDFLGIVFRYITDETKGAAVAQQIAQVIATDEAIKLADKMLETSQDAKARAELP